MRESVIKTGRTCISRICSLPAAAQSHDAARREAGSTLEAHTPTCAFIDLPCIIMDARSAHEPFILRSSQPRPHGCPISTKLAHTARWPQSCIACGAGRARLHPSPEVVSADMLVLNECVHKLVIDDLAVARRVAPCHEQAEAAVGEGDVEPLESARHCSGGGSDEHGTSVSLGTSTHGTF